MENQNEWSKKGSAMISGSSLNDVCNVDSFQKNEMHHACRGCDSNSTEESDLIREKNHLKD